MPTIPGDPPPAPDITSPIGPALTLLQQREIEARIVGPLILGFIDAIGRDNALAVVRQVIAGLARAGGAELARRLGDDSLAAFAQVLDLWSAEGALEIDVLERSPERLSFNVTRCKYAEMYRALGLADLGVSLSCGRDFAVIEGFNPGVALDRTQTLMEGAPYCDFRFRAVSGRPGTGLDVPPQTPAGTPM